MTKERGSFASRIRLPQIALDGKKLKLYGCVTMFFYTLSMTVFQNGLIKIQSYEAGELHSALASDPRLMALSGWATVFELIGGLAVPVFAFLLTEGFLHTSGFGKYLLSMLVFAAVSEVPYDLAMYGKVFSFDGQNVMLTYAICLIMLYGLRMAGQKSGAGAKVFAVLIIVAAALWASMLRTSFGLVTVLLCAVYYLLRDRRGAAVLAGCAVSVLYITAPLSGYALWSYTGDRGKQKHKYVFYALYPLHLIVLAAVTKYLI